MTSPNYSILYSATISGAGTGSKGDVLITDSASPNYYVLASAANRGTRRSMGVAMAAYSGVVEIAQVGHLGADVTGLAAGTATWLIVSSAGRLERKAVPVDGDDIIGRCEADGSASIWPGVLTADMVNGLSGSGAVGVCTLEQFGAVGDGVTSDQAAYVAALAAVNAGTYSCILLGAGKTYLVESGTISRTGSSIIGHGEGSVLKTASNQTVLTIAGGTEDVHLADFSIFGNTTGAAQNGIVFDGAGTARFRISNVAVRQMGNRGYSFAPVAGNLSGGQIESCRAQNCGDAGYHVVQEYIHFANCLANACTIGIRISAGNVTWTGGTITSNTTGVRVTAGGNDAHGIFSGAQINHNNASVYTEALSNQQTFDGCHIYDGSMTLSSGNTQAVRFDGCHIDQVAITAEGAKARFLNCTFTAGYSGGSPVYNDNSSSDVEFVNCVMATDGSIPSFIGQRMQIAYTFPGDANQALSAKDSRAVEIIVAAGVLTAGRTLTSARAPNRGHRVTLVNNNAQAVTLQWSSGTGVAVAAGARATIGADGTNAVQLG